MWEVYPGLNCSSALYLDPQAGRPTVAEHFTIAVRPIHVSHIRWVAVIMARKKLVTYSGALSEPIVQSRPASAGRLGEVIDPELWSIRKIWLEKFKLLFAYYQIELERPDCWEHLALMLAIMHVPGFRIVDSPPRKRGRPKKRSISDAWDLALIVDAIAAERKRGIKDAVRTAAKRYPKKWPTKTGGTRSSQSEVNALVTRYYEAKELVRKSMPQKMGAIYGLRSLGPTKIGS